MKSSAFYLVYLCCMIVLVSSIDELTPEIGDTAAEVQIEKGNTAVLPCEVKYIGANKVLWRDSDLRILTMGDRRIVHDHKFSVERPNTSSRNLHIRDVSLDDAGVYTCVVSTDPSMVRNVTLSVLVPPTIERHALKVTQQVGGKVVIDCSVTASPEAVIMWRKFGDNEIILTNTPKYSIAQFLPRKHTVTSSLKIVNLTNSDFGIYTCEAYNRLGNADVSVEVIEAEPSDSDQRNEEQSTGPTIEMYAVKIYQDIGGTVFLEADVISSQEPGIVWKHEDVDIISNDSSKYSTFDYRNTNHTYTSLKITNITRNELGVYTCQATTINGTTQEDVEVRSHSSDVGHRDKEVKSKVDTTAPIIHDASDDVIIAEGSNLTLLCNASGTPEPTVTWYRLNQGHGEDREKVSGCGNFLNIVKITREQQDIYECRATNDGGTSRRRIEVTVQFIPSIEVYALGVAQEIGGTVVLSCIVTSSPAAVVMWKFGIIEITNSLNHSIEVELTKEHVTTSSLRIVNLTKNDFGRYTCEALNVIGKTEVVIEVVSMSTLNAQCP